MIMPHDGNSLEPGPIDNTVLNLQHKHRSGAIWKGQDPGVLTCRQRLATMMRQWPLDERLHPYIYQAGFYGVYRVGFIQLDWALITALVERWREETHTFHLAVGEATVTLQDVAILLGLRVHGDSVTGSGDGHWGDLSEELLGIRPDGGALQGSALKLSWLRDHFLQPPPDADDEILKCYARAYILGLMGGSLFADKSGSDVHMIFLTLLRDFEVTGQLSWGSATLAHLYRELCRASKTGAIEIAGPLILLQLWAWERLHIGRPDRLHTRAQDSVPFESEGVPAVAEASQEDVAKGAEVNEPLRTDPLGCRWRVPFTRKGNPCGVLTFYRDQLDQQREDQMIWQPYTPEALASLPSICVMDQPVWRAVVPLICFDIVEWQRPDRVLRQFGLRQGIPEPCDNSVALHAIDKRGRHHFNWRDYHAEYIKLWSEREQRIAIGEQEDAPMHYFDPYMEWYRKITRRFITPINKRSSNMRFTPTGGATHLLVQSMATIYNRCTKTISSSTSESAMQALADIQNMCIKVLQAVNENHAVTTAVASSSPCTPLILTHPPLQAEMTSESPPLPPDFVNGLAHFTNEELSQVPISETSTAKDTAAKGKRRGTARGRGCGSGRGHGRGQSREGRSSSADVAVSSSSVPIARTPSSDISAPPLTSPASPPPLPPTPSSPLQPLIETTEIVTSASVPINPALPLHLPPQMTSPSLGPPPLPTEAPEVAYPASPPMTWLLTEAPEEAVSSVSVSVDSIPAQQPLQPVISPALALSTDAVGVASSTPLSETQPALISQLSVETTVQPLSLHTSLASAPLPQQKETLRIVESSPAPSITEPSSLGGVSSPMVLSVTPTSSPPQSIGPPEAIDLTQTEQSSLPLTSPALAPVSPSTEAPVAVVSSSAVLVTEPSMKEPSLPSELLTETRKTTETVPSQTISPAPTAAAPSWTSPTLPYPATELPIVRSPASCSLSESTSPHRPLAGNEEEVTRTELTQITSWVPQTTQDAATQTATEGKGRGHGRQMERGHIHSSEASNCESRSKRLKSDDS